MTYDVLIPALNEAASLPGVLAELHRLKEAPRQVVVIDNGSTDGTGVVARNAGAVVVEEHQRGYGAACLRGLAYLAQAEAPPPDVVVFLDGDGADDPRDLSRLLSALSESGVDLVIGSRVLGTAEAGALQPAQRLGNALSVTLIRLLYGSRFTDLGPFRAIRYQSLQRLRMGDRNFGWTVEMQVKAARLGVSFVEVPVSYRRRKQGRSKVSGTVSGTLMAGIKILYTIGRYALSPQGPWGTQDP